MPGNSVTGLIALYSRQAFGKACPRKQVAVPEDAELLARDCDLVDPDWKYILTERIHRAAYAYQADLLRKRDYLITPVGAE